MSNIFKLSVGVVNSPEEGFELLLHSFLVNYVFLLDAETEDLPDGFFRQLVELLGAEGELRRVFRVHLFLFEVAARPVDELYAVHARHVVVDDDDCNLVFTFLFEELLHRLCDGAAAAVEGGLVLQFEAEVHHLFERKKVECLVLKDENLGVDYLLEGYLRDVYVVIQGFDGQWLDLYACNEFVESLDFTVLVDYFALENDVASHGLTQASADVQAQSGASCADLLCCF